MEPILENYGKPYFNEELFVLSENLIHDELRAVYISERHNVVEIEKLPNNSEEAPLSLTFKYNVTYDFWGLGCITEELR